MKSGFRTRKYVFSRFKFSNATLMQSRSFIYSFKKHFRNTNTLFQTVLYRPEKWYETSKAVNVVLELEVLHSLTNLSLMLRLNKPHAPKTLQALLVSYNYLLTLLYAMPQLFAIFCTFETTQWRFSSLTLGSNEF